MHKRIFILMAFSLFNILASAEELKVGAQVPAVKSVDHEGQPVDLAQALAEGTCLVFFYPKAMTPGCTKQACSLRDGWDKLQDLGVKVFGVSSDTAKTQAEFREKHSLPFTLIADVNKSVAKAFGKSRWSRQAYLFKDGVLIWRDLSAATSGQMDDVIEALDQLNKPEA